MCKYKALFAACMLLFVMQYTSVHAATIAPLPSAAEKIVGEVFPVQIIVSSTDQAMNALGATISFPVDKLEVVSISKLSTIVDLWLQEPSFDNRNGSITFEGVVFDPGYRGSRGQVVTVNFKVKSTGVAPLSLDSGTVLANDGEATEILSGLRSAKYILVPKSQTVVPVETTTVNTVSEDSAVLPVLTSSTHPDQDIWYKNNTPHFSWDVPDDATETRTLIDQHANSVPTVSYHPPISEKQVGELEDGVWYFHVRFKDKNGWSKIAHYRVKIDTNKPTDLDIVEVERENNTQPNAQFILSARDNLSGVERFDIEIDGKITSWTPKEDQMYTTEALTPGSYTLNVEAYDRAGNSVAGWVKFNIEGFAAPSIKEYTNEADAGETVYIKGTVKNSDVIVIYAQFTDAFGSVREFSSDEITENGEFVITLHGVLPPSIYTVKLTAEDGRGAKSNTSDEVSITVNVPGLFGLSVFGVLYIVLGLIAAVLMLFGILLYQHRKTEKLIRDLDKEMDNVDKGIIRAVTMLKKDIQIQITHLKDGRSSLKFTKAEKELVEVLQNDLRDLEKYLQKQIKDIEDLIDKKK